jgi:hypothetical protein
MIDAGSLEYAHARLCARYGDRPDELAWRRIETLREFRAMLDAVRASHLGAWIADIGPDSGVHAIEFAMRAHWRSRVTAIAAWMPAAWCPAIEWCGLMVELPVLQHLARRRRGCGRTHWRTFCAMTRPAAPGPRSPHCLKQAGPIRITLAGCGTTSGGGGCPDAPRIRPSSRRSPACSRPMPRHSGIHGSTMAGHSAAPCMPG